MPDHLWDFQHLAHKLRILNAAPLVNGNQPNQRANYVYLFAGYDPLLLGERTRHCIERPGYLVRRSGCPEDCFDFI
jgi:hypothetical protein